MKAFLDYMETKQTTDDFTRELENDVSEARHNKEWMVEYMKTYVWEMDIRNEGREEGREEGVAALISTLKEFGCSKQDAFDKLMEKMGLSEGAAKEYVQKYWE